MGRTERNGQFGSLRIGGRYRLVEKLGTGGMSEVWRGYDETLGRSVAVKLLAEHLTADENASRRFQREARAAASLSSHPNVVTI